MRIADELHSDPTLPILRQAVVPSAISKAQGQASSNSNSCQTTKHKKWMEMDHASMSHSMSSGTFKPLAI